MDFIASLSSGPNIEILTKLAAALVMGAVLGLERVFTHKAAGMRTYALVSMGSAFFVIVADMAAKQYFGAGMTPDPLKMIGNIIVGVGFLGAGIIILKDSTLVGLTTAAGLWLSAGIGMAAGFGYFGAALLATIMTLIIFTVLFYVEHALLRLHDGKVEEDR